MENGKAKLLKYDYCDGLGNCLPVFPVKAISFKDSEPAPENKPLPCGCPSTNSKTIEKNDCNIVEQQSALSQWPIQIKLIPVSAPYFKDADLLISADCAVYAYGNFHKDFIKEKITLIGCPKLDNTDYSEKLTAILKNNNIKTITVGVMEVPCCAGIEEAVKTALKSSQKSMPCNIKVVTIEGQIK
jgi:hypothetical protein